MHSCYFRVNYKWCNSHHNKVTRSFRYHYNSSFLSFYKQGKAYLLGCSGGQGATSPRGASTTPSLVCSHGCRYNNIMSTGKAKHTQLDPVGGRELPLPRKLAMHLSMYTTNRYISRYVQPHLEKLMMSNSLRKKLRERGLFHIRQNLSLKLQQSLGFL